MSELELSDKSSYDCIGDLDFSMRSLDRDFSSISTTEQVGIVF